MLLLACKLNKTFVTMLTFVRPFTSMNSFMGLHISLLYESFATKSTFVFFQIHMNFFVPSKRTLKKKKGERVRGLWNWISCLSKYVLPEVGYSLLQNLQGSPLNSEWVLTWAGKFLFRTFLLHTSHSTSYKRKNENEFHKQNVLCKKAYFRQ